MEEFRIKNNVLLKYCGKAEYVVIPDGVEKIEFGAFLNVQNLKSVSLPASVKKIADEAFAGCKSLEKIIISDVSKINMAPSAFRGCTNLPDEDGFVFVGSILVAYKGDATEVIVPEKAVAIGTDAFRESEVTKVTLSEGLEYVDGFRANKSLKTISIPASVKKIAGIAFAECESLEKVVLSEGLEWIANRAFYKCTALKKITIPASVKVIGQYVFENCPNITVYCVNETRPRGWYGDWDKIYDRWEHNNAQVNVVWGYKGE